MFREHEIRWFATGIGTPFKKEVYCYCWGFLLTFARIEFFPRIVWQHQLRQLCRNKTLQFVQIHQIRFHSFL